MRSIALIFSVLLTAFTLITCSGSGDGDGNEPRGEMSS